MLLKYMKKKTNNIVYIICTFIIMAKLPQCGWFDHCVRCQKITSRLVIVKYFGKQLVIKKPYVCLKCRETFVYSLFIEFEVVVITKEIVAEQTIRVSMQKF